jgi:fructose-1-phosphate kinase PfkB-like protein
MIWCVTLNPSLDVTYRLAEDLLPGSVGLAQEMEAQLGGKGNNVARVVHQLGGAVTMVEILGGHVGLELSHRAAQLGIPMLSVEVEQDSRICVTIVGTASGALTELRAPGPFVNSRWSDRLLRQLCDAVSPADWVTISGSLPPGLPADTYAVWVSALKGRVAGIIVDAAGEALREAVQAAPTAIVPNRSEYEGVGTLLGRGQTEVIVTEGKDGVHWYARSGEVRGWQAPKVKVVNSVGAGDTFLGALTAQLAAGVAMGRAIPRAIATASASVETLGVAVFDVSRIEALLQDIKEANP